MTEAARFWSKVHIASGCWIWTGAKSHGYGVFARSRPHKHRMVPAHRWVWESLFGPIGDGLVVRHLVCDNPPCVRPSHLAVGTPADNNADTRRNGRHAFGERHGMAKLTQEDVLDIRQQRLLGMKLRDLADRYGVTEPTISVAARGVYWSHLGARA